MTNQRVVALVEARLGSTRLPGKNARPILGAPMLARLIERLQRCRRVDEIVLATTDQPDDQVLVGIAHAAGVQAFCGSRDDVLSRAVGAARSVSGDVIVEITGDCPLTDPAIVDACIERYLAGGVDYVANMLDALTFPVGFDAQVYATDLLEEVGRLTSDPDDRVNVTPFIYHHPERYRLLNLRAPAELARPRYWVAVDHLADFEAIASIYEQLYPRSAAFDAWQIVELLDQRPDLVAMTSTPAGRFTHPDSGGAAAQEMMPLSRHATCA